MIDSIAQQGVGKSAGPLSIRCHQLNVEFPAGHSRIRALQNLSFQAPPGQFVSIIGPSGCGKTTLLRTLAHLVQLSSGHIEIDGSGAGAHHRIAMVHQDGGLFPWMTVMENAAFALEAQGVPKTEREARSRVLLERFGLEGREKAYPHQISAGMRQRVAFARCFLSRPGLLLMDEPFAALDAQTRLRLQNELLGLWERQPVTVIFVTHDIDEAILLSDRIVVLSAHPGTVVRDYKVRLERPRRPAAGLSPAFLELKAALLDDLGLGAL